jgi:hypothetical protein
MCCTSSCERRQLRGTRPRAPAGVTTVAAAAAALILLVCCAGVPAQAEQTAAVSINSLTPAATATAAAESANLQAEGSAPAPTPPAAPAQAPGTGPGGKPPDGGAPTTKITYVTSASVYIDAGSEEGLALGDLLDVVRDGNVVGKLKVAYLSSHRASCTIEGAAPSPALQAGDTVRYGRKQGGESQAPGAGGVAAGAAATGAAAGAAAGTAGTGAGAGTPGAAAAPPGAEPAGKSFGTLLRGAGLRGRIGVRWLAIRDRTGTGQDLSQPGIDLRLDGTRIGGAPVDVNVDVRAQRSYTAPPAGASTTDNQTRVYRLSASWNDGPARVTLGRQFSPSLSTVSLFDGVLGEYRKDRWGTGVMAGTQPDPVNYGFSSDIREYGGFFEYGSPKGASDRWLVTTGLIGSYAKGEINREFLYLQGLFSNRFVSTFVTQEVDYNRGWRKQAEGSTFSDTSTFAIVRVKPVESFSFDVGYDNRRNVRLYRDYVTPETTFDDAYRRGSWAGVEWRPVKNVYVGVNGRKSDGGTSGTADSYSLLGGVSGMTALNISARLRATQYKSEFLDGTLYSLGGGIDLKSWGHFELEAGQRNEKDPRGFSPDRRINWQGLNLDILLGRHWFGLFSLDRTSGGGEDNNQAYVALSYRF